MMPFPLILKRTCYQQLETPITLASGKQSKEYLDCKKLLCTPAGLQLVSKLVYDRLLIETEAIGGITMGADPISISVSMSSAYPKKELNWFSIRKEPKGHGTNNSIVGNVSKGTKVCIVEDVVTTGNSTIQAIIKAREFGLEVVQVIALVDREENGIQNIKDVVGASATVVALTTLSEIRNA